jgi:hypothetical protein
MIDKKFNQHHRQGLVLLAEDMLNEIREDQKTILLNLSGANTKQGIGDWISDKEAQQLLGRKATTLWSLRKRGELAFTKVGNKVFYSQEDILQLLNKNKKGGEYVNLR